MLTMKYDKCTEIKKLVVEDPALTQANVMILDENGEETDWCDLHV